MKRLSILLGTILVAVVVTSCASPEQRGETTAVKSQPSNTARQQQQQVIPTAPPHREQADAHDGHHSSTSFSVPAFQSDAASLKNLAQTLSPNQFSGQQKAGYQAAGEIPRTIAQLPCYCHCDEGFGHKSLHSCFEDEHAAHCAVCIDEALMAYQLEKVQGLKPEQIRERIVTLYSSQQ